MDIKTFSDELRSRMNAQIDAIKKHGEEELSSIAKVIHAIRESILELKRFIHRYEFKDQEEEIFFFKEIKPSYLSEYLFHHKIFAIELNTSFYNDEEAIQYYKSHLKQLLSFYSGNKEFYTYLKSGASNLDNRYFVRRNHQYFFNPDVDHYFSTGYDNKVARILAYESLKEYLENKIKMASDQQHAGDVASKLTWTASKTDLVELIYALHARGCINHGKAQIKEIVGRLNYFFNIDLGEYYRTYLEIRIRKTGRTKFMDMLKEGLERRMEEVEERRFG